MRKIVLSRENSGSFCWPTVLHVTSCFYCCQDVHAFKVDSCITAHSWYTSCPINQSSFRYWPNVILWIQHFVAEFECWPCMLRCCTFSVLYLTECDPSHCSKAWCRTDLRHHQNSIWWHIRAQHLCRFVWAMV